MGCRGVLKAAKKLRRALQLLLNKIIKNINKKMQFSYNNAKQLAVYII